MKKILIALLSVTFITTSLQAEQSRKDIKNSKLFEYRDIKAKIIENERSLMLKYRAAKADKITSKNSIKASLVNFREKEMSRQAKQFLLREARYIR